MTKKHKRLKPSEDSKNDPWMNHAEVLHVSGTPEADSKYNEGYDAMNWNREGVKPYKAPSNKK